VSLTNSQANKSEELSTSFTKGYEASLKKYHNFVIKGVFAVAMKACPYRADFYAKLGSPIEAVEEELAKWLAALDKIIAQIEAFYEKVSPVAKSGVHGLWRGVADVLSNPLAAFQSPRATSESLCPAVERVRDRR
jgi:hypothetical protein